MINPNQMNDVYNAPASVFKTDKDEVYASVFVDDELKLAYVEWDWKYDYGFDAIQTAAMALVDVIRENGLKGAIADLRKVEGNWDPINSWIIGTWLPAVQEAGATHWVHVQPKELFAELSAEILAEGFMLGGLQAQNVKTIEEGQEWWRRVAL